MIRRELPRTKRAGWGRGPYRIEADEDSPFRGIHAAFGAAVRKESIVVSLVCLDGLPLFGVRSDGPDKAQQLAGDCCHTLILVLAVARACIEAFVQAMLGFPGNRLDLIA